MPTNQKTPRLGLNNWVETDKPMRVDFTSDNLLLDEALGAHLEDTVLHLTGEDREVLANPAKSLRYSGNGAEKATVTLPFAASAALVFAAGKPLVEFDAQTGRTICNAAVVSQDYSGGGISLMNRNLVVKQKQEGEVLYNLNEGNTSYGCIAFH